MVATSSHWDGIYRDKRADDVSWFQRSPETSLRLIRQAVPDTSARILDVGGGASTLVDALLADGYANLTVLDIAANGLRQAQARLGADAARITWMVADIILADLPSGAFDLWHDRAAFHFLTDAAARVLYVAQVHRAVRPGGHVLIATFADDGPMSCSGLPVARYSETDLQREMGDGLTLVASAREQHVTPWGTPQSFVYGLFTKPPFLNDPNDPIRR